MINPVGAEMIDGTSPVIHLETDKAWDILAGQRLGRLAIWAEDGVDIFPINYAVDGESIVFRTAEGSKLSGLKAHNMVTFETDRWDPVYGFSVVAKGRAVPITSPDELRMVTKLKLRPWVPTVKLTFVRIVVTSISGRRFEFGQDPVDDFR